MIMKKHLTWFGTLAIILMALSPLATNAQEKTELQYFRSNDKEGLNVFETPKEAKGTFDKVKVFVGGDFALQFQTINNYNNLNNLVELGSNVG